MKKLSKALFLLSLLCSTAIAQNETMHLVVQSQGAETYYSLSEVSKLDFTTSTDAIVLHVGDQEKVLMYESLDELSFREMISTGVPELAGKLEPSFTVAPVPFADDLTIRFELEKQNYINLKLVGVNGVTVLSQRINGHSGVNEIHISTAHLASGIYICILENGKDIKTQKIIKK